jgi:hypothetical protein
MKKKIVKGLVGVAAGVALLSSGLTPQAEATRSISCGGRDDYFTLYTIFGTNCYADAGSMYVNKSGVSTIKSGNNDGSYTVSGKSYGIKRWGTVVFAPKNVTVSSIYIK